MNQKIADTYIKQNDEKVELIYHNSNVGCLLIAAFLMIAMCVGIFIFLPDSFLISLIGIMVAIVGIIFTVSVLKKIFSVRKRGNTLITIENNKIRNDQYDIRLSEITEINFGWRNNTYKSVIVTTKNKQIYYFPTYNLISDRVLEKFVDGFVFPHVAPNATYNKEGLDHHHVQNMSK